jgi:hypothetical protein
MAKKPAYAPVTGIPIPEEEIRELLAGYKAHYPDKEFPSLENVQEFQKWFREKYWEPRLHELGIHIVVSGFNRL